MLHPWKIYAKAIEEGDFKTIARCISLVENEVQGYDILLETLQPSSSTKITGITGPPGAGKSTLVDALIGELVAVGSKVAVLCVDPSSPFNLGALLGDRVRMSSWYNHPDVFIRSLATRGSLGGLHPGIIEITELLKAAPFDHIIVETVGVGQSEVEITGLSDTTLVVLVPESGDEIQAMKSGLMEIADIFVVNKADRPDAGTFIRNLQLMISTSAREEHSGAAIIQTVATEKKGLEELMKAIQLHQEEARFPAKRSWLLTQRAFQLLQQQKMKSYDKNELKLSIEKLLASGNFNLFQFVKSLSA